MKCSNFRSTFSSSSLYIRLTISSVITHPLTLNATPIIENFINLYKDLNFIRT